MKPISVLPMNSRGILFSIMVFLLALMVLTLGIVINEINSKQGKEYSNISALSRASNAYSTMDDTIVDLGKESMAVNSFERILPFDYAVDSNSLFISQRMPLQQVVLDNYFDILNSYAIFVSDRNYLTTYSDFEIDVNTVQNALWGGAKNEFNFVMLPQCLRYKVSDINQVVLSQSTYDTCISDFNSQKIMRYDLNVSIKTAISDFNSVSCSFAGVATCPNNPYSPLNPQPYFKLIIDDSLCRNCILAAGQKTIASHYNPSADNNILIRCIGASCISAPMLIQLSTGPAISHNSDRTDINLLITFRNRIETFKLEDFNFSIRYEDYNIFQTNVR